MSEEPQVTETPAAPKKPRKQRRTRRVQARPAAPAPQPAPQPADAELVGLTPNDCCDSCYEKGVCAISGDVCVHPFKGGLQSPHQMKPDVVRRFNRAKRLLRNQKIELRDAAG